MLSEFLKKNITSQAKFITGDNNNPTAGYGFGQVEPNHLSAQRTSQVYAQLPAAADINMLEQGQFVKYDYANGVCNFTGAGEWMLVFNEIKLYREGQMDCEFAMIKDNYQARVYSPLAEDTNWDAQSRYLNGKNPQGDIYEDVSRYLYAKLDSTGNGVVTINNEDYKVSGYKVVYNQPVITNGAVTGTTPIDIYFGSDGVSVAAAADKGKADKSAKVSVRYLYDDVTAAPDMYEIHYNEDPFHFESSYHEKMMPAGTTMVPRVFKTNVGDIMTTNTINSLPADVTVGKFLTIGEKGLLTVSGDTMPSNADMVWQVVKVYTMPDHQPGVKVMRVA